MNNDLGSSGNNEMVPSTKGRLPRERRRQPSSWVSRPP